MKPTKTRSGGEMYAQRRQRQRGQTMIIVVVILAIFLLAFAGLAVDYSNLWYHRQAAQGAADAACQAGAMDLLLSAQGQATGLAGFTPGTDYWCSSAPTSAPCRYAALNGYTPTAGGLQPGESNDTQITFPSSAGYTEVNLPPSTLAPVPLIRAEVVDRARVWFSSIVTGRNTQDVRASAACGLSMAKAPIPIIVLNPTCEHAFEVSSNSARLAVIGGPTKSVQVNSAYTGSYCAAAGSSSANQCGSGTLSASSPCPTCQVDLSQGGPSFTGSNFGTFGRSTDASGNPSNTFAGGTTGKWVPGTPIADPYAQTAPPPNQTASITDCATAACPQSVPYGTYGCPDHTANCQLYYPGKYVHPIVVSGGVALFVPGVYQLTVPDSSATYRGAPSACSASPTGQAYADLAINSGGVVRPATGVPGYASGGTIFYTQNAGVSVIQNAGTSSHNIDQFDTNLAICTGGTAPDPRLGMPRYVDGNVLLGQCTNDGSWIATTGGTTGPNRGIVVFQDRALSDVNRQTTFRGSGSLLIAGTLYAHNCPNSPTCDPTTDYKAFIQLQGTSGSGTYVLGEIITDELVISGNGSVAMALNPNAVLNILKVTMIR